MVPAVFTPGQLQFISRYAQRTGLNPMVVAAQVFNEMNGSAAAGRQAAGDHDWLNIGRTDAGPRGQGDPRWNNPITAADASAEWALGKYSVPGFGPVDSRITAAITGSVGKGPAAQIAALQQSPWASSHYPNLPDVYQTVLGSNLNLPAASGVPLSTGVPASSPTAPPSGAAPFPNAKLASFTPPPPVAMPDLTGALLSSLGQGPGDQLSTLANAILFPQPSSSSPLGAGTLAPPTATPSPSLTPPTLTTPKVPKTPKATTPTATAPPGSYPGLKVVSTASTTGLEPTLRSGLQQISQLIGKPISIQSGYRSPSYSAKVGGYANDPHSRGEAVDAYVDGKPIGEVVSLATLKKYGLEGGNTPGFYRGKTDPEHVQIPGSGVDKSMRSPLLGQATGVPSTGNVPPTVV